MARPSKSAKVMNNNLSKEIVESRIEKEMQLKGLSDELTPPEYLNNNQKFIFSWIVEQLKEADILSNLDIFIVSTCAIAIDRLQAIENEINNDFSEIYNAKLMTAKNRYSTEFFRTCNELSLSPQSRAKLANINVQAKDSEQDPLLKLIAGEV